MRPRHVTLLLLLLAGLGTGAPAQAAQLTVDDDRAECPSAEHVTLTAAVDAAIDGDTVTVCPGSYTEGLGGPGTTGLLIDEDLTIRGAGSDLVTIRPNGSIGEPNAANRRSRDRRGAVIGVEGADVDLSGITVRGNGGANQFAEAGLVFRNAAGSSLSNSRITDIVPSGNPFGLGTPDTGFGLVVTSSTTSGDLPFTLAGTLIEGYNKAGALIDSRDADLSMNSGSHVRATVTGSVIRGHGPQNQQRQHGIQVSFGASAAVTGSTISGNRFTPEPSSSSGLLFDGSDLTQSSVHASNVQGNGYGVSNLNPNGSNQGRVDATDNFWGDPDGPSRDGGVDEPPPEGDRVSASVDTDPFRTVPVEGPAAPATQPDTQPGVTITSPADGTTLAPGTPTAVTATAADDVGVRSVTFRRGAEVLGTDTLAPYDATYTPSPAESGTSQSLTATASDSRGQSATSAISVRVAGPAGPPPGNSAADDASPSVEILEPAIGTVVSRPKAVTLAAGASDDRAVDNVTFVVNDREVCRLTAAPYRCSYFPTGADVGRITVVAIVTDSAGQTATAVRSITIGRFTPRGLTTVAAVERSATPFRVVTRGKLALSPSVTPPQGCAVGGAISVELQVPGGKVLTTDFVRLRSNCTYVARAVPSARRVPSSTRKLTVRTRFLGNGILERRRGTNVTVTLPRSRRAQPPPVAVDPNA